MASNKKALKDLGNALSKPVQDDLHTLMGMWHFVGHMGEKFSTRGVAEVIAERDRISLKAATEMTLDECIERFEEYMNPPGPTVELDGEGKPTRVLGECMPALTSAQYKLVKALVEAGDKGLSKAELEGIAGDPLKTLRRLRTKYPLWAEAIQMAGRAYGRYRIKPQA